MIQIRPSARADALVRVLTGLLRVGIALSVFKVFDDAWDVSALVFGAPHSASYQIAAAAGYVTEIGWAYRACMAMMLPAMLAQLLPGWEPTRWAAKLAMLGIVLAAVLWIAQWYLTRHTELDVIRAVYLRRTITSMSTALFLGVVLNALLPFTRRTDT